LDYGESLDFADNNDRRTIKLINPKSTSTTVRIQLQAAGAVSLAELDRAVERS
jgi:peptide deformylase